MIQIPGYTLQSEIYHSPQSDIWRGKAETDGQTVILKIVPKREPWADILRWFQREFELTRSLTLPVVVQAYDFIITDELACMVLEDFGGTALNRLDFSFYTIERFLEVVMQATQALGHLHEQHIIHKDINPANILINVETNQLKIADLGIATQLSREAPLLRAPESLEGTLAYISPEQTGRMNRALDYRTDFYSLGVMCYELLTGQLPFPEEDPLTLIHHHLAQRPLPPHLLNPDIPEQISAIILKLMAKSADERYQSTQGLWHDWRKCQQQYRTGQTIASFPLGEHDHTGKLQIPQVLYGRAVDVEQLMTIFKRVSKGGRELVFVTGPSGIGKSAVVRELYKPITRQKGFFLSGKFDQFQRNIPYTAIIQAFRGLVRQLLAGTDEVVAEWRRKVEAVVGENGAVLLEVWPELELLLGPQKEMRELPPAETENRFKLILQNFVHLFAQEAHPLVLFLDDVQWADTASLKFLEMLSTDVDNEYLLLIGAYRDNEVAVGHPLLHMQGRLREEGVAMTMMPLAPLTLADVTQFLSDTIDQTAQEVHLLAVLLLAKTAGNPFFLNEFLQALYHEKLLYFDHDERRWLWDLAEIERQYLTHTVLDLVANKLALLDEAAQSFLATAACIGNQFDLHTLAVVVEEPDGVVARALHTAAQIGLLHPLSEDYKLAELGGGDDEWHVRYQFAHDRVQQAVYGRLGRAEVATTHYSIGQHWLAAMTAAEQELYLFDIVNQFNQAQGLLSAEERLIVARLNLEAGHRAKGAVAYDQAMIYLEAGLALVGERWEDEYELVLALHTEAAEGAYLAGDLAEMERLAGVIVAEARQLLDTVALQEIRIQALMVQQQLEEGIVYALGVLAQFGFELPTVPQGHHLAIELGRTLWALRGVEPMGLRERPLMTDPTQLAIARIASSIYAGCYLVNINLFLILIFKMVRLSLQYGNTASSAFAYAGMGIVYCGVLQQPAKGYAFGQLGLALMDDLQAVNQEARIRFVFNTFIRHWQEPAVMAIGDLHESFQAGLAVGDIEYASYSLFSHFTFRFYTGQSLTALTQDIPDYHYLLAQFNQETTMEWLQLYQQVAANWQGQGNEDPYLLVGDYYDEVKMLPVHEERQDIPALIPIYFTKMALAYGLEDYERAWLYVQKCDELVRQAVALFMQPFYYFYDCLICVALLRQEGTTLAERRRWRWRLRKSRWTLRRMAGFVAANNGHRWHLVMAETAVMRGQPEKARPHYEEALRLAIENQFTQDVGLIAFRAFRFYEERQPQVADFYLEQAYQAYQQWGAYLLTGWLEEQYPQLRPQRRMTTTSGRTRHTTGGAPRLTTTDTSSSLALDLNSALKASQSLSGEIVLEKLLAQLMKIVIENAGAQHGFLLLEERGKWVIAATEYLAGEGVEVALPLPLEQMRPTEYVPLSVVQYVLRTHEHVVLSEARTDDVFMDDPYIRQRQPQSVLCAPLLRGGKLAGILYLENNLTAGAFTAERLQMLNLLAAQAAISLENARLYENLTAVNRAYERFVPNQFLSYLGKASIVDVELGDNIAKEMSIFFADIRNFTKMSEKMTPAENFQFVNALLHRIEPLVIAHDGFIDKYIGDGVMALFPHDANDAVRSGIAILQRLQEYNLLRLERGRQTVAVGIGIHTGLLMMGTIGGHQRMDSTVISDAVNLAARVEQLTKQYGVSLLVTADTYEQLEMENKVYSRLVDKVVVKGRTQPVEIYEIYAGDEVELRDIKHQHQDTFHRLVRAYHDEAYDEAREILETLSDVVAEDRPLQYYRQLLPIR
ncbi:MAG TPA: AAA family ATPase [Anaerolineae bacterium]|nr:AAA family ATPase [Anaerolineae bacterium]